MIARGDPMHDREPRPFPMEWRRPIQPPRHNHLLLGGARAKASIRNQLDSSQTVTPAPGSPTPQQRSKTASEASKLAREDPAETDNVTNAGSRSRRCRHDRRGQTRPVAISSLVDAARHQTPLSKTLLSPLGLPNVPGLSCAGRAKRDPASASGRCWAARHHLPDSTAAKPWRFRAVGRERPAFTDRSRQPRRRQHQPPAPRTTRPASQYFAVGKAPTRTRQHRAAPAAKATGRRETQPDGRPRATTL